MFCPSQLSTNHGRSAAIATIEDLGRSDIIPLPSIPDGKVITGFVTSRKVSESVPSGLGALFPWLECIHIPCPITRGYLQTMGPNYTNRDSRMAETHQATPKSACRARNRTRTPPSPRPRLRAKQTLQQPYYIDPFQSRPRKRPDARPFSNSEQISAAQSTIHTTPGLH
jgi:hypothetical protein